jgi:hypothetical protein
MSKVFALIARSPASPMRPIATIMAAHPARPKMSFQRMLQADNSIM